MTVIPGSDVVIFYTDGTTADLTNEAMQAVDTSYKIYEIISTTKRYLAMSTVPTFQKSGNGIDWEVIPSSDIERIEYAGGRLVLKTALSSSYYVRCSSAKHYSNITQLIGGTSTKISDKNNLVDVTTCGDTARARFPTIQEWSATLDTIVNIQDGGFPQISNLQELKGVPLIAIIYLNQSSDMRFEGYCYIESADINLNPDDVIKQPVSLQGFGPLYFRSS